MDLQLTNFEDKTKIQNKNTKLAQLHNFKDMLYVGVVVADSSTVWDIALLHGVVHNVTFTIWSKYL